jgi:hypothetical protein
MTSYVTPKKNTAFILYVGLEDQANAGLFKAAPTLAAGDFKVSIDGGTLNNLTDLPAVVPTGGKMVKITLTAGEMNGDNVTVVCSDAAGAEWYDLIVNLQTTARQIDDLGTSTYAGADTAGTTTLLARIIGTLATGTHNPQTGDAYAVVNHATYGNAQLARTGADSDTLKTLSDQIDTVSGSTIAAAVWAVASGSGAEDSYGNILDDLTEEAAGTYRLTTAALAMAPGGGATTYSYTTTVDDGSGNLLDGVFVQCATDTGFTNIVSTATTNSLGAFTVYDDVAGTHYLRLQFAGYSFAIQTVTLA